MLLVGICGAATGCVFGSSLPPVTPDLIQANATTISSGAYHTCALRLDGSPVCWGADYHGYGQAPGEFAPTVKLSAITSGAGHSCGLGVDGSWECWGSYDLDTKLIGDIKPFNVEPPGAQERFRAISSGAAHTCALRPDGEAVCWGKNGRGQASPFEGESLRAVSSGYFHTCAIRLDGTPVCWSFRAWTKYWPTDEELAEEGTDLGDLSSIKYLLPGENRYIYIQCPPIDRDQGSRCSEERREMWQRPHPGWPPEGLQLKAISSGGEHTCALRLDGSPVCWGKIGIGQPLNNQEYEAVSSGDSHICRSRDPRPPDSIPVCHGFESLMNERFVAISAGGSHTCALRGDGSPVCWGFDSHGKASPPEGERFVAISAGGNHTCGLRVDGSPVCWGWNWEGQASPPRMDFATAPGDIT